jgi:hypothetical protein
VVREQRHVIGMRITARIAALFVAAAMAIGICLSGTSAAFAATDFHWYNAAGDCMWSNGSGHPVSMVSCSKSSLTNWESTDLQKIGGVSWVEYQQANTSLCLSDLDTVVYLIACQSGRSDPDQLWSDSGSINGGKADEGNLVSYTTDADGCMQSQSSQVDVDICATQNNQYWYTNLK